MSAALVRPHVAAAATAGIRRVADKIAIVVRGAGDPPLGIDMVPNAGDKVRRPWMMALQDVQAIVATIFQEQAVLSEALEKAVCIDLLDVSELCSREPSSRRLRLVEGTPRISPTQPNYQRNEYWVGSRPREFSIMPMGWSWSFCHAQDANVDMCRRREAVDVIRLVAPSLARLTAKEQRQDNAIQEEKRKAAENGAAGATPPPPKK